MCCTVCVLQHYQYCWVVDPIDGTKEFIKRNGEFTVMIGLVQVRRQIHGNTALAATASTDLPAATTHAVGSVVHQAVPNTHHMATTLLPEAHHNLFTVYAAVWLCRTRLQCSVLCMFQ
jgi:3'-phosphoadenosine 5'-phosphosulfate (PAPS) 3'-phosphatase